MAETVVKSPLGREWLNVLLGDLVAENATEQAVAQAHDAKFNEIRKELCDILNRTGVFSVLERSLTGLQRTHPRKRPKQPFIFLQRTLEGPKNVDVDALRRKCEEQKLMLASKDREIGCLYKEIKRLEKELKEMESDSDDPGL